MKLIRILLLLSLAVTAGAAAPDILQELSISKAEAESEAFALFADRAVDPSRFRKTVKVLSPEARAALVERGLSWTKAYVESAAFVKAYAARRESLRPKPPVAIGSVDEELARRHAKQDEEMKAAEKQFQELPPEMRTEVMKNFRESVAAMKAARPQIAAMERQAIVEERKRAQADYETRLAKWKEGYPESPRQLVVKRLREFLASSRDVDFSAQTTTRNKMAVFANSEYEAKPSEWKLCYRAGEPAVRRARAFAEAWLAEIETNRGQ
jgi:hypothetical protein